MIFLWNFYKLEMFIVMRNAKCDREWPRRCGDDWFLFLAFTIQKGDQGRIEHSLMQALWFAIALFPSPAYFTFHLLQRQPINTNYTLRHDEGGLAFRMLRDHKLLILELERLERAFHMEFAVLATFYREQLAWYLSFGKRPSSINPNLPLRTTFECSTFCRRRTGRTVVAGAALCELPSNLMARRIFLWICVVGAFIISQMSVVNLCPMRLHLSNTILIALPYMVITFILFSFWNISFLCVTYFSSRMIFST